MPGRLFRNRVHTLENKTKYKYNEIILTQFDLIIETKTQTNMQIIE